MFTFVVDLEVSCAMVDREFKVFICKNIEKVEITRVLTDWELRMLREKYDLERLKDWAFGPEK